MQQPPDEFVKLIEAIRPHFAEKDFLGFDVPLGWIFLVSQLNSRLESRDSDYVLLLAKEKFGGLKFYADCSLELEEDISDFRGIISEYEIRSLTTCQVCGSINAHPRDAGWVATLCDACFDLLERGYW